MKLNEVLNSAVRYNWTVDDEGYQEAQFEVNGKDYTIAFVLQMRYMDGLPPRWDIEFALDPPKDDHVSPGRTDVTGTGDQFIVMSTIQQIIRDWAYEAKDVQCITMTALTSSRKKLYTRMLQNTFKGWKIHLKGDILIVLPPD